MVYTICNFWLSICCYKRCAKNNVYSLQVTEQFESEVATPAVDTEPDQTAKLATPPPEDETAALVILFPH